MKINIIPLITGTADRISRLLEKFLKTVPFNFKKEFFWETHALEEDASLILNLISTLFF
jgi:hypothetical protein